MTDKYETNTFAKSKVFSEYQLNIMGYYLLRDKRPTRTIANEYGDVNVINADGVTTFAHWMYLPADTIAWRPITPMERLPSAHNIDKVHGFVPFTVNLPLANDFTSEGEKPRGAASPKTILVLFADKKIESMTVEEYEWHRVHPLRTMLGWKKEQLFTMEYREKYWDGKKSEADAFLRKFGYKPGAKITEAMHEAGTIEVVTKTGRVQVWDLQTIKRMAAEKSTIVGWKAVKPFEW